MNLQNLRGKRIAIWGMGKEGHSSINYLRKNFPDQQITLIDDQRPPDNIFETFLQYQPVEFETQGTSVQLLSSFDIIIKSPGISIYRPEIKAAQQNGVIFTSATNLWFDAIGNDRVIAITGTNGKTTTASILAYLLTESGLSVALGGNTGTPLLDLLEDQHQYDIWVIELSSYQTCDLDSWPEIGILLNLYPEHIQWHASLDNYYKDKLNLFINNQCKPIVNFLDPISKKYTSNWDNTTYFNITNKFHFKNDLIYEKDRSILSLADLKLVGKHNLSNICAVFTALDMLGINVSNVIPKLREFRGLPHRLQVLGEKDNLTYIDDSISTTPESAMAAIESFPGQPITILLGGQNRQQQYQLLIQMICDIPIHSVITMYETGSRIAELVQNIKPNSNHQPILIESDNLEEAMIAAKKTTAQGGIILLSPAAPSYDAFSNYQERGTSFKQLAGF